MTEAKKPAEKAFRMPEGRLIYHNLFVRGSFKDPDTGKESDPRYSAELTFDPAQVQGEGTIEDIILEFLDRTEGGAAGDDYLAGKIHGPFVDGNQLAADREARKKNGDAYKGKLILRPANKFNARGDDAPGGIQVLGPDTKEISLTLGNQDEVYNGCYGLVAVKLYTYKLAITKQLAISTRLVAFQKTRDGDRLGGSADYSSLFEPVGGAAAPAAGRRSRAG